MARAIAPERTSQARRVCQLVSSRSGRRRDPHGLLGHTTALNQRDPRMLTWLFDGPIDRQAAPIALALTIAIGWLAARLVRGIVAAGLRGVARDKFAESSPLRARAAPAAGRAAFLRLVVGVLLFPAFQIAGLRRGPASTCAPARRLDVQPRPARPPHRHPGLCPRAHDGPARAPVRARDDRGHGSRRAGTRQAGAHPRRRHPELHDGAHHRHRRC